MKSFDSKILIKSSALLALILFCASAQAITLAPWVTVGNANNANDINRTYTGSGENLPNNPSGTGHGSVAYDYRIAQTEVTNAQYVAFLNAVDQSGSNTLGLYNTGMTSPPENPPSPDPHYANSGGILFTNAGLGNNYAVKAGFENKPVVATTYFNALRFTNWLFNGATNAASTETGAYTLDGGTPIPSNPDSIVRNPGANVFLPNEDEWYKAAYYDPDSNSYFTYAAGTNAAPTSEAPPGGSNSANFWDPSTGYALHGNVSFPASSLNPLTDVGAYSDSLSPYGTLDQGGNVMEWFESTTGMFNPSILNNGSGDPVLVRGLRGGGWEGFEVEELSSGYRLGWSADEEDWDPYGIFGFRIGSLASFSLDPEVPPGPGPGGSGGIPEPSTLLLSAVGLLGLMRKRRRSS